LLAFVQLLKCLYMYHVKFGRVKQSSIQLAFAKSASVMVAWSLVSLDCAIPTVVVTSIANRKEILVSMVILQCSDVVVRCQERSSFPTSLVVSNLLVS